MAGKATTLQTNFTGGEISERALGRFDLAKYPNSVKLLENFLIYQLGGGMYRPGTRYVAAVKYSAKKTRLIQFQYSTEQSYAIEVGDQYMRFYSYVNGAGGQLVKTLSDVSAWVTATAYVVGDYVKEAGVIYYCIVAHTSAGAFATDLAANRWVAQSIVEIPTPYLEAEIFDLQFTQKDDTMYIVHKTYAPRKLTRTNSVTFSLAVAPIIRGPFRDTNVTTTTITPSADTGAGITLTASTAIFQSGHVGSLWRVKNGVVKITAYGGPTSVTATVQAEPSGTAGNLGTGPGATTDWAEGAFSEVRGYPTCVNFHEQRLYYGSTPTDSQTVWGSFVAAFDNFKTDASDDSAAVAFLLVAEQANKIRWLSSIARALQNGTAAGTHSMSSGTTGSPITADNINAQQDTNYGVLAMRPQKISSYLYYVQKNSFQLRELVYDFLSDRQKSNDMTLLADHILRDGSGAYDIAHQQSPNDRIWVVRTDGQIAVLTRNPEQEVIGWSRLIAGTSSGLPGKFESVAITENDRADDTVWVVVKRKINGSWVKYVEYFMPEDFTDYFDPVRVDSSLTLDSPITITGATKANPCVVTAPSHGLSNGDQVKIDNVQGMTELNGKIYKVKNVTANTVELTNTDNENINSSSYTTYLEGGELRKMVTVITGLSHLNGETVTVQTDGGIPAAQTTYTVSGGQITLQAKAAVVHVGLAYTGKLRLLKLNDGSIPSGQAKSRRIYLSTMRVYRSLGIKIGKDFSNLRPVHFNEPNQTLGKPPDLVTGDVEKFFNTGWSSEDEIAIQQDQPLPLFILAIILRSEVEEK